MKIISIWVYQYNLMIYKLFCSIIPIEKLNFNLFLIINCSLKSFAAWGNLNLAGQQHMRRPKLKYASGETFDLESFSKVSMELRVGLGLNQNVPLVGEPSSQGMNIYRVNILPLFHFRQRFRNTNLISIFAPKFEKQLVWIVQQQLQYERSFLPCSINLIKFQFFFPILLLCVH